MQADQREMVEYWFSTEPAWVSEAVDFTIRGIELNAERLCLLQPDGPLPPRICIYLYPSNEGGDSSSRKGDGTSNEVPASVQRPRQITSAGERQQQQQQQQQQQPEVIPAERLGASQPGKQAAMSAAPCAAAETPAPDSVAEGALLSLRSVTATEALENGHDGSPQMARTRSKESAEEAVAASATQDVDSSSERYVERLETREQAHLSAAELARPVAAQRSASGRRPAPTLGGARTSTPPPLAATSTAAEEARQLPNDLGRSRRQAASPQSSVIVATTANCEPPATSEAGASGQQGGGGDECESLLSRASPPGRRGPSVRDDEGATDSALVTNAVSVVVIDGEDAVLAEVAETTAKPPHLSSYPTPPASAVVAAAAPAAAAAAGRTSAAGAPTFAEARAKFLVLESRPTPEAEKSAANGEPVQLRQPRPIAARTDRNRHTVSGRGQRPLSYMQPAVRRSSLLGVKSTPRSTITDDDAVADAREHPPPPRGFIRGSSGLPIYGSLFDLSGNRRILEEMEEQVHREDEFRSRYRSQALATRASPDDDGGSGGIDERSGNVFSTLGNRRSLEPGSNRPRSD